MHCTSKGFIISQGSHKGLQFSFVIVFQGYHRPIPSVLFLSSYLDVSFDIIYGISLLLCIEDK